VIKVTGAREHTHCEYGHVNAKTEALLYVPPIRQNRRNRRGSLPRFRLPDGVSSLMWGSSGATYAGEMEEVVEKRSHIAVFTFAPAGTVHALRSRNSEGPTNLLLNCWGRGSSEKGTRLNSGEVL